MNKTALILAAIASAAAIATAPAHAGPRLQFGGPLGSFEATPYAKGSSHGRSSYSRKRSSHAAAKAAARRAAAKKAHARKLAAKKAAARKYAAEKAARQKLAAKKAAARRQAAKNAHAEKLAANRAAAKKIAAKKAVAAKARNLAQLRKTEEKRVETAATTDGETKRTPVKASAIAGTNTLKIDREDTENTDVAALAKTEPVKVEAVDEKTELECKKYIPSAGLTITVPCGS